jgi:hypothetical protein
MRFLKKLKIKLPDNPAISLLGKYPKDGGSAHNRDTCTLFTKDKLWSHVGVHQLLNEQRKCDVYTQCSIQS